MLLFSLRKENISASRRWRAGSLIRRRLAAGNLQAKIMNKIKTTYEEIISIENLICADEIIRSTNDYTYRVAKFDEDWYGNINRLHLDLKYFTYEHSGYDVFYHTGADGKRRKIQVCKNYRDRIVQKASIIASKDQLVNKMVGNTYSSIPGRGTHKAINKIKQVVKGRPVYCMPLDIYHFFEQIDQGCMIETLRQNFKDEKITWLFGRMLSAVENGIALGAEDSQWHSNLYLTKLDHLILQKCKPESYTRYCDDLVLIDPSPRVLERSMAVIEDHLSEMKLQLKPSKRIFQLAERRRMKGQSGKGAGLDFLGYVFYQNHTDLRKKTKERWRRRLHVLNRIPGDMEASREDIITRGVIIGLLKHCDSKHLLKKWKNEYKNYFERLQRREAAKVAASEQRKEELAALLEREKRTGEPNGRGRGNDRAVVGQLRAATLAERSRIGGGAGTGRLPEPAW